MDQVNDNITPALPVDRVDMLAFLSTVLLAARIIAVRGQPVVKGEIIQSVEDAQTLMTEVERRCG